MGDGINTIINAVMCRNFRSGDNFTYCPAALFHGGAGYSAGGQQSLYGNNCPWRRGGTENAVKGLLWLIETAHLNCRVIHRGFRPFAGGAPPGGAHRRRQQILALCSSDALGDILTEKEP